MNRFPELLEGKKISKKHKILSIYRIPRNLMSTYGTWMFDIILNLSAKMKASIEVSYDQISNMTIADFKMLSWLLINSVDLQ